MTFGEQIEDWRKKTGISGADLERRIDKSRGYVARLISGDLNATKDVCVELGKVFEAANIGVTTADVMAAAVPEVAGDWVRDWYEARLESQRVDFERRLTGGENLSGSLAALVQTTRALQGRLDRMPAEHQARGGSGKVPPLDVAQALTRHLELIEAMAEERAQKSLEPWADNELRTLLYHLYAAPAELPDGPRKHLIRATQSANVSTVNAWSAAKKEDRVRSLLASGEVTQEQALALLSGDEDAPEPEIAQEPPPTTEKPTRKRKKPAGDEP